MDGLHVQVDASPEFRLQCLDNRIEQLDIFILTHGHSDHAAGMDDLRRFCEIRGGTSLPVWTTAEGTARIREMFPYAIGDRPLVKGYPAFTPQLMPEFMDLPQGSIRSTLLPHGKVDVLGLVFEERSTGAKFVYYTDCKAVSPAQRELARGAGLVVLDGLRHDPHPTHMNVAEAVDVALDVGAPLTLLTHCAHAISHARDEALLPPNVRFAYDGLVVEVGPG
jgi:phosphoribosyl 1,2-cyclic phosphate phosphodiesterase